jgi:hypothetical protein
MNSPPCHAAQNGWINSATSWLDKRTVIDTPKSSGVATTARTQGTSRGQQDELPEPCNDLGMGTLY